LPARDESAWRRVLLLYRDANAVVIMNRFPYTGGHLLVAPRRHTADLAGLRPAESRALWELTRISQRFLKEVFKPQGFNLGMNLGRAAGAGVEDHLHMHVLPRWVGDTNFMPVVGETHSLPVALETVWDQLRPRFRKCPRRNGP
jgi:ATP adenylyltransferase